MLGIPFGLLQLKAGIGLPWWAWLLVLVVAFIILAMLTPKVEPEMVSARETKTNPSPEQQDLTRIEGIGPKIQDGMRQHGIHSFAQLAEMDVAALRALLGVIGIGADPSTWPAQARLAAAGNWEALQNMQDELTGGRVA